MNQERIITLQEIRRQKAIVRHDLEKQKKAIVRTTKNILHPQTGGSLFSSGFSLRSINKGFAVFDGIMFGIRLVSNLRKIFK